MARYGVDFGTSNSLIALNHMDHRGIEDARVVEFEPHVTTLPSVVYVSDQKLLAGKRAVEQILKDRAERREKTQLVSELKLMLDEKKSDEALIGKHPYALSDMIAALLRDMRAEAERVFVGQRVSGAVVGVPIQYDDRCKDVMFKALVKGGFYQSIGEAVANTDFVPEPIAVALDYGVNIQEPQRVMVFDFGGGTLDVSILDLARGGTGRYPHSVLYKGGLRLGGERLTRLLFENCFIKKHGAFNLIQDLGLPGSISERDLYRAVSNDIYGYDLIQEIEKAKIRLSQQNEFEMNLVRYDDRERRRLHVQGLRITRGDLENAIQTQLDAIRKLLSEVLGSVPLRSIDRVLMAGGSSMMPCIQRLLLDICGQRKVVIQQKSDMLESVVRGLALAGRSDVEPANVLYDDITDSSYGLWDDLNNEVAVILPKGTKFKDARLDQLSLQGKSGNFRSVQESASQVTLQVYQDNEPIGEITLDNAGSGRYKIFFSMDEGKGYLVVEIYDRRTGKWLQNPYRRIKIRQNSNLRRWSSGA